jgi:hypothetical protein
MKLTPSEQYVQELFQSRFGVLLQKIDEAGGIKGRTPDFEYIKANKRKFVCELKDLQLVDPSDKDGWEIINHPDGSVETWGKSNYPNRISKKISEGYKQLSKYSEPKIMIFLNYSINDFSNLVETFQGYSEFEYGKYRIINTFARPASEGIKDVKSKIDLYIWIDPSDSKVYLQDDNIRFLTNSETGRRIAREYFGVNVDTA